MRQEVHHRPGYAWRYVSFADDGSVYDLKEVGDGESYTGKRTPYMILRHMVPELPTEKVIRALMVRVEHDKEGWKVVKLPYGEHICEECKEVIPNNDIRRYSIEVDGIDGLEKLNVLGQEINVLRPRTVHIPRICEDCAEDMR